MSTTDEATATSAPPIGWRTWAACGLMLLATALNYMDRQALAQQASEVQAELGLSNEHYGNLEFWFGIAFAVGGVATGFLVDALSLRWLYPAILLAWSAVGYLTGGARSYEELLMYRVLLGFFEAGQWPCALAASQRLLSRGNRALGNSILQSGASLGAIATPLIVLALNSGGLGGWRTPFRVIGALGAVWVVAWLVLIRPRDLEAPDRASAPGEAGDVAPSDRATAIRRIAVLIVVVIAINLCWQYFRAWMPKMLEKEHGYGKRDVQLFSSAYYLAAGVGCLAAGVLSRRLATGGRSVHGARMATFAACVALTGLSCLAAFAPASWLLLGLLLAIGFGSLGQFPTYYAFTQEISTRWMGRVTGVLSFTTWIVSGAMHKAIGQWIDRTGSYAEPTFLAGLVPVLALIALLAFWNAPRRAA
ncbi:MFS transporter [Paludisphaera mucosa]|uniref:MFS transporter n=1 Tax=Paludisphaera mucosa TaxID=3030827 RepID=A0ABT6FCA0_9BACT|nr:MFS transporter [Paludisphaera mucosa]MDG3005074.1 MFS transporter [Paludisphaera mucosa]